MFRYPLALFLALAIGAGALVTPAAQGADDPPVSVAEWRETCREVKKTISPAAPDFLPQLWEWVDRLFQQAKAAGEGLGPRGPGRIAFIKFTVLTSYIVQRQGTTLLKGEFESEADWFKQIGLTANSRKDADATFGADVMRKSWESFVTISREQRWAAAPSPYEAPVNAP